MVLRALSTSMEVFTIDKLENVVPGLILKHFSIIVARKNTLTCIDSFDKGIKYRGSIDY